MSLFHPEQKIFQSESALSWRNQMRTEQKKVVLTNGCFDLLHRGHAEYLMAAKALGDALIVLLNSDRSVRELKGPERPVNNEMDRAFLMACLSFVDAVMIFDSIRCDREIAMLKPDFYAKGGDYTVETLNKDERAALFEAETEIRFIEFVPGHSTSSMLKKMK